MLAVLLLDGMIMKRRVNKQKNKPTVEEKTVSSDDVGSAGACCRTCLGTEDLEPIFASKDCEKKRSHELNLVTGLEIKMDDGLSQKICSNCVNTMKIALQFRRTSKKAQKELLNMISKKPRKKYKLRKKVDKNSTPKMEVEIDFNDEYNMLVDDFQNDDDVKTDEPFLDSYQDDNEYNLEMNDESADPTLETFVGEENEPTIKQEKTGDKRKRMVIPNASSYKCNTCNKEFRMKATYKAHMRFHTNYCVCETCGKRCRNNNQLQEHKRARHGLGRIHKCAYCEYSSATKEALVIHERRHTGERPYICDHCGATFHRRSNLVQHIAIHLPEKNFQCTKCNKREKSKKRLQVHEYKAHRAAKYAYVCPACGGAFARLWNARRHVDRAHAAGRGTVNIERVLVPSATEQSLDLAELPEKRVYNIV